MSDLITSGHSNVINVIDLVIGQMCVPGLMKFVKIVVLKVRMF